MKLEQIREVHSRQPDFINDFFDNSYSRLYLDLLDIELKPQIDFLEKNYFEPVSTKTISTLDLCCGTGRHLKKLSEKGYSVDGVDMNPEAVDEAKKNATLGKVYLSDIQFFKPDHRYDLVYSMESSLGYLSDSQTIELLRNVKENIIKETGVFVLHLINREYAIKNFTQRIWFGNATKGYLLEDRIFDALEGILKINQVRIVDGLDKKYSINLRLYSLKELSYLLNEAGLHIKNVYGDYDNSKYGFDSPYMIIECSSSNKKII